MSDAPPDQGTTQVVVKGYAPVEASGHTSSKAVISPKEIELTVHIALGITVVFE